MKNKSQHYVPVFYLKNFSINRLGKVIGIFNIPSRKYIPAGSLKHQACRAYFYGKDGAIEDTLAAIETIVSSVFREIVKTERLPEHDSDDHLSLLIFMLIQYLRTMYARDEYDEATSKALNIALGNHPQLGRYIDRVNIRMKDPLCRTLGSVAECWPMVRDLRCRLIAAKAETVFVTSDNPVVPYNQFLEEKGAKGGITGLAQKGLQFFYPVSPVHTLMYYDPTVYRVEPKSEVAVEARPEDVKRLNLLQAINCSENIYFHQNFRQGCAINLSKAAQKHRRSEKSHVWDCEIDDQSPTSTIVYNRVDIRCGLRLTFVKLRKKAKSYALGEKLLHLRDEELEVLQERKLRRTLGKTDLDTYS